jgi:hypothetical protein
VFGHRAAVFLQVLETSPCRGGAAEILSSHYDLPFYLQEKTHWRRAPTTQSSSSALWFCLHRFTRLLH